jgi:hypothetical protein
VIRSSRFDLTFVYEFKIYFGLFPIKGDEKRKYEWLINPSIISMIRNEHLIWWRERDKQTRTRREKMRLAKPRYYLLSFMH